MTSPRARRAGPRTLVLTVVVSLCLSAYLVAVEAWPSAVADPPRDPAAAPPAAPPAAHPGPPAGRPADSADSAVNEQGVVLRARPRAQVVSVSGHLSQERRRQVARAISRALGGLLTRAYLADDLEGALPVFTPSSATRFTRDAEILLDPVVPRGARVTGFAGSTRVYLVSPGGRLGGATVQVRWRFRVQDEGATDSQTRQLAGRLAMTPAGRPAGQRWRVFGYDLSVNS